MAQQRKPRSLADDAAEQIEDLSTRRDILATMGGQKSGYEDSRAKRRPAPPVPISTVSPVPEDETSSWWMAFLKKALSPSNYGPQPKPDVRPLPLGITGRRG